MLKASILISSSEQKYFLVAVARTEGFDLIFWGHAGSHINKMQATQHAKFFCR